MNYRRTLLVPFLAALACNVTLSQDAVDDRDELKIAAIESLIMAPPEEALPRVKRVLEADNSNEVKQSALFILSQIDTLEAQSLLVETAKVSTGDIQIEAVQMIGIGGNPEAIAQLSDLYDVSGVDVREAVLSAYLIADEVEAVLEIAAAAESEDEFETAVNMLAVMDATEELRGLRNRNGLSAGLIEAYAISGDFDSLREIALDGTNREQQIEAIEMLGLVDHDNVGSTLVSLYSGSDDAEVKEAALSGMLIADYDDGVLALYRETNDPREKAELLEMLTVMDSDAIWEIIDSAIEGEG